MMEHEFWFWLSLVTWVLLLASLTAFKDEQERREMWENRARRLLGHIVKETGLTPFFTDTNEGRFDLMKYNSETKGYEDYERN